MKILIRILVALLLPGFFIGIFYSPSLSAARPVENLIESVDIDPLPLQAICPGALVEVGGVAGIELGSVDAVGQARIVSHGIEAENSVEPVLLSAEGADQSTDLLAAHQFQGISRPRLSGLAAINCPAPASSGYFVSANSGPGNEAVLLLANLNRVDVLVELEIHIPGEIITDRIPLAAGTQKQLPLIGLAGPQPSYAVGYRTSGLPISAALQQRSVSGLAATGVELVPPQRLSNQLVFPGLQVLTAGFEPVELRLLNPGVTATEASVQIYSGADFELFQVPIQPGALAVQEFDLPAGNYLVFISAEVELAAAIKTTQLEPSLDFAWLTPAAVFETSVTVPVGLPSTLFIANPTLASTEVQLSNGQTFSLGPRSQRDVAVDQTVGVKTNGSVAVSLAISATSGYSVVVPTQMQNSGKQLQIRIR